MKKNENSEKKSRKEEKKCAGETIELRHSLNWKVKQIQTPNIELFSFIPNEFSDPMC